MDANQRLFDAAIRHQVEVRRLANGEARKLRQLMEKLDADLVKRIRGEISRIKKRKGDPRASRNLAALNRMLTDIRLKRDGIMDRAAKGVAPRLISFGNIEVVAELKAISQALPMPLDLRGVSESAIRTIVTANPFQGNSLAGWFQGLKLADRNRLLQQIRIGVIEGQSVDDIVRRLIGTRANRFRDGVLSVTRRQAEAIVRTAISHVSNEVRESVWRANASLFQGLMWVAILDGRTTPICFSRDGKLAPIGDKPLPSSVPAGRKLQPPTARPPAHVACRSSVVPWLDGASILGERTFVRDKRDPKTLQADFRAQARTEAGVEWSRLTEHARRKRVAAIRERWASENIGTVPTKTTYQDWLKRQPAEFQDDVLGKTKGELFRRGGLTVSEFVDRTGQELTLAALRQRSPAAFERAGV